MAKFIELPSGRIINLDNVKEFNPNRSNRLDWLVGGHELVTNQADSSALLKALRGTPGRRPKQPTNSSPTTKQNT